MNDETRKFIRLYLNVELANEDLKGILNGFRDDYVDAVRRGLAEAISGRELSVYDYEEFTDFEFPSEDELYVYLSTVYAYVFEDADRRPRLPPL